MSDSGATADRILAAAGRIVAAGECAPRAARDPVNHPTIRNWLEALGDANPRYEREGVAPPAMVQVWTMRGLRPAPPGGPADPLQEMSVVLDEAGYTSVVATDCEQAYLRELCVGEQLDVRTRLTGVAGPKRTALGEGWFVTTRSTWYVGDEPVATMVFRVLKFRPDKTRPTPPVLRPVVSRDTEFFWAGTAVGELRVQRCGKCGLLRHPPGPACPACGATVPSPSGSAGGTGPEFVRASGRGTVFSYVVHHHPPVPGRTLPIVVVLVELAEGVRMVGELLDAASDGVGIGAAVEVAFVRVDDELTLPAWRLRDEGARA
jgi:3-oxo-4,17-pregnadiene-20-carboxyl-CoA hydratase alpha subunit